MEHTDLKITDLLHCFVFVSKLTRAPMPGVLFDDETILEVLHLNSRRLAFYVKAETAPQNDRESTLPAAVRRLPTH